MESFPSSLGLAKIVAALYRTRADLGYPKRASLRASRVPRPARTEPRPPRVDVAAHGERSMSTPPYPILFVVVIPGPFDDFSSSCSDRC